MSHQTTIRTIASLGFALAMASVAHAQNASPAALPRTSKSPAGRASTARTPVTAAKKPMAAAPAAMEMTPDTPQRTAKSQEGDLVLMSDASDFGSKSDPSPGKSKRPSPRRTAPTDSSTAHDHGATASSAAYNAPNAAGVTQVFFPTGERSTSAVLLERINPVEVRVGVPFGYEIKLTNLTGTVLKNVQLTENLAAGFELKSSTPAGGDGTALAWTLGDLGPRETKAVTVSGSASKTGALNPCANVTFTTDACSTIRVVQPALVLSKTLPERVILCDPIPLKIVVQNSGTGPAKNVRITDSLPDGLATTEGETQLAFNVGDLPAGQLREFNTILKAARPGSFANTASAREDGGLTAEAAAQVVVGKPELTLTKSGPETRYVGRPAKYEITLTNSGDAPANDCVLSDDLPAGTAFIEATGGGSLSGNKIVWKMDSLAPGASQTVNLTLKPTAKGAVKNTVMAKAYCAEATASYTMQALGIPAVLLEVLDVEDPIEVGATTTYEVVVTNQGTAEGTNIVVVCSLPAEEEFVSAIGPTSFTQSDKTITFAPLAKLPERTKATYRITVKGSDVGDVRFHTSMTSDQAKAPVEETESTHIYK